jgi:leucyl-tRNA synthetase
LYPDEVEKRGGKVFLRGTNVEVTVGASEAMSKSKKNVIAPEVIADLYGADTIRWFMLSDTPPERDIEWTAEGAEGCWRFVQRIYRMVNEVTDLAAPRTRIVETSESDVALRTATHRAIQMVTDDLQALRFNRAVAQIYTLANAIGAGATASPAVRREALETIVLLSAPMMPHLAETCWEALGHRNMVVETPWPKAEVRFLRSDTVTIAVQINGKRRGEVTVGAKDGQEIVQKAALSLDPVKRALDGKPPKRVIVVPGRIVNIVV